MKMRCLNCGHEFDGPVYLDELGPHGSCPACEGSFDVDVEDNTPISRFYSKSKAAATEIVERFEDLLDLYNIKIPDDDRTGSEDEAPIYGCTYGDLIDGIVGIIIDHFDNNLGGWNV